MKTQMLTDEEILILCKNHARNFLKYRTASFDELVNVAFIKAKMKTDNISIKSSIIWALLDHTKYLARTDQRKSNKSLDPRVLLDKRIVQKKHELNPQEILLLQEEQELLLKAVAKLKPEDRQLIYWHYRDNMTFTKIGEELCCSRTWASGMLKTILTNLRNKLNHAK